MKNLAKPSISILLFVGLSFSLFAQPPYPDDPFWNTLKGGSNAPPQRSMACPASNILSTPYNSNNGQRGCMFDVTVVDTLTVSCFEANLYAGTTANYEIYYRAGSHVGFENNAAGWTFIGSATGITSAGNNLPTVLPIPINVTIPAGERYSFYITNDFGGGTSYTDGTSVGNLLANDSNISVYEGVGKSYPFGLTFTVRNFNGTIFYNLGGSLSGPEMAVLGNSLEITNGDNSPSSNDLTDFGSICSIDSLSNTFQIDNSGASLLTLDGSPLVDILGPDANNFSISSQPSAVINPSTSSSFTVQYKPLGTGSHTATISIENDDADEDPYTFDIRGTADLTATWYADTDNDTYGDPSVDSLSCLQPTGYVSDSTDCDDTMMSINPGAQEVCDGIDNDCDGLIDDDDPSNTGASIWYLDSDGDNFGAIENDSVSCMQPIGYVMDNTDCSDTIFDPSNQCDIVKFISIWKSDNPGSSANNQIIFGGHGSNYLLEWSEVGNPSNSGDTIVSGEATIDLPSSGTYRISVSGGNPAFNRIEMFSTGDEEKLLSVENWGAIEWSSFESAFRGCKNVRINAIDVPDLSDVERFSSTFFGCESMNDSLNHWDVSNVRFMNFLFSDATSFNQPLSNWDVSNVESLGQIFRRASSFNQNINSWNTEKVTDFYGAFEEATSFNQPLSDWDVSSAENLGNMFVHATEFNQNLNQWDVDTVNNMSFMFLGADAFNQPLNNWDVGEVTDMSFMFFGADAFNQPLNNWDVSKVVLMNQIFTGASSFNQNLNSWQTGEVTNLFAAFNDASSYNQPMDNWDVAKVTNFDYMFSGAALFNQSIKNWDIGQATSLTGMFTNANAFDQNLDSLNVVNIQDMQFILNNTNLSVENYDSTLLSWSQHSLQNDVTIGVFGLQYCESAVARDSIISKFNWHFSGDSQVPGTLWFADIDGDGYGDPLNDSLSCFQPIGYISDNTDCNDTLASINSTAQEICDGIDNNCDGLIDNDDPNIVGQSTWYLDSDNDTYGDSNMDSLSCDQPIGYVSDSTDCDDTMMSINPSAQEICDGIDNNCDGLIDNDDPSVTGQSTWYLDSDNDTYGDPNMDSLSCDQPAGYVSDSTDCDDTMMSINPSAQEVCDGIDNNCDGLVDNDDPNIMGQATWYLDSDNDTYGDPNMDSLSCDQPIGYVSDSTDCDDTMMSINPGAQEVCDGIDNNCDGLVDNDDPNIMGQATWYLDSDNDTYGDPNMDSLSCDQPVGYVADNTDCDDTMMSINPSAQEVCDGIDNNCDGLVDNDDPNIVGQSTWYLDSDSDTYGDPNMDSLSCDQPIGYVADNTDCDDTMMSINPGAQEVCDGVDNNCDGLIDDDDPTVMGQSTWYLDNDNDSYGDPSMDSLSCDQPLGYVADNTDCDDTMMSINPGAQEVCDGVDNNCNGLVDNDDPDNLPIDPPMLTCPGDVTIQSGSCFYQVDDFVSITQVSDPCDPNPLVEQYPEAGSYLSGNNSIRIIARNIVGLSDTCYVQITHAITPSVETIYVSQNASRNKSGANWTDAFSTLQNALYSACLSEGDTVAIAEGDYYTDQGMYLNLGDRSLSFDIPGGITLIGGFDNGGNNIYDPLLYPTYLSGNIGNVEDDQDNAYHVVSVLNNGSSQSKLRGVVIEDGFADGPPPSYGDKGGGLLLEDSDLYLEEVVVQRNYAEDNGSALYGENSNLTAYDVDYSNNKGSNPSIQSAVHFHGNSILIMERNIFDYNQSNGLCTSGGASSLVRNSLFHHNAGFAIKPLDASTDLTLRNVTIADNQDGGVLGVFSYLNCYNSIIWNNNPIVNLGPGITYDIQYNIVKGGLLNNSTAWDNTPQFIGDYTHEDNYRLSCGSPAIDLGTSNYDPGNWDLAKASRITNSLDLGAYESSVLHGQNKMLSSYDNLYQAVALSCPNDIVEMDATADYFDNSNQLVMIKHPLTLQGQGLSGPKFSINEIVQVDTNFTFLLKDIDFSSPCIINRGNLHLENVHLKGNNYPQEPINNQGNLKLMGGSLIRID